MRRIWFVSDVHLVLGDDRYLDQFLAFLEAAAERADELWIVGDLFEFWIGDRQGRLSFYAPLFDRLRAITSTGRPVRIVHGNRDFLMGEAFAAAGCEMMSDEVVLELAGQRVHVSHGDQFCIHDRSYQRARRVMRSRPLRALAGILPGFVGHWLARSYRGISERKKTAKKIETGNRFHTIRDGVLREFEAGDHDVVLCGHIHHMAETRMVAAGRERRVLTTGAWEEEGPNYVAFEDGALELRHFDAGSRALAP